MEEYTVLINGIPHTMMLDKEHAKQLGDRATPVKKKAATPANKSRSATSTKSSAG